MKNEEYIQPHAQPSNSYHKNRDIHFLDQENHFQRKEAYDEIIANKGWRQPYGDANPNAYKTDYPIYAKETLNLNQTYQNIAKIAQEHQKMAQNLARQKGRLVIMTIVTSRPLLIFQPHFEISLLLSI